MGSSPKYRITPSNSVLMVASNTPERFLDFFCASLRKLRMNFREWSSGWKRSGSLRAPVSHDRWTILTDSMNSAHSRSRSRMETMIRRGIS